jgi:hypothetical protein
LGCAKMANFVRINDALVNVDDTFYVFVDKVRASEKIDGYTHCVRISSVNNNSITIFFGSEEEALEVIDELEAQLIK